MENNHVLNIDELESCEIIPIVYIDRYMPGFESAITSNREHPEFSDPGNGPECDYEISMLLRLSPCGCEFDGDEQDLNIKLTDEQVDEILQYCGLEYKIDDKVFELARKLSEEI